MNTNKNKLIIQELHELSIKHPNAIVKFEVSEDTNFHEFNSLYIDECDCSVRVEELTEYDNKLLDLDDLMDNLGYDILDEDGVNDLSDAEYVLLLEYRAMKYCFKEYIIVRIG